ncbi:hypothetical protein F443_07224 [Phytophthora nicotianae P1569]|uniref:Uncharacterized protein n=1 Tax=Phytophthora nicotianae P1569 TaxID=1317065 RepID=V9FDD6_PHYNI|nr:hypothetical protein F443_07224 [Phytophthora nicotianae P1569]
MTTRTPAAPWRDRAPLTKVAARLPRQAAPVT